MSPVFSKNYNKVKTHDQQEANKFTPWLQNPKGFKVLQKTPRIFRLLCIKTTQNLFLGFRNNQTVQEKVQTFSVPFSHFHL